nr:MAG: putative glycoprotein [Wenzhou bat tapwovirus 1]
MMFAVFLLGCVCLFTARSDVWIPSPVPTLWGPDNVAVTTVTFKKPNISADPQALELIDKGFGADIVSISPSSPSTRCEVATYLSPASLSDCVYQVWYSSHIFVATGFIIESDTSPGLYKACAKEYKDIKTLSDSILTRTGFGLQIKNTVVPQSRNISGWCFSTALRVSDVEGLIPQQCVSRLICRNFGAIIHYDNGAQYQIEDVTSEKGLSLISSLVKAQGLEVREDFSECRTPRCIVLPQPKMRRVRRDLSSQIEGVHCGGLIVYMYCPHAADSRSVSKIVSELEGKLGQVSRVMIESSTKLTDLQLKVNKAVVEEGIVRERWMNNTVEELNRAFRDISIFQVSHQAAMKVALQQEGYLRGLLGFVLNQRTRALEITTEYAWYHRLSLAVARQQDLEAADILAEKDIELSGLLAAGYTPVLTFSLGADELNIAYSKPRSYKIHLAYLPARPYIRLEDTCSDDWCERCITQSPVHTRLAEMNDGSPDLDPAVTVTPFNITACSRTGAPSFMYARIGDTCFNITIDQTSRIPCHPYHEYPTLSISVPVSAPVTVSYAQSAPLSVPFLSKATGSRSLAILVETTDKLAKETLSKMSFDLSAVTSYHSEGMLKAEKEARTALVVGALGLTLALAICAGYLIRLGLRIWSLHSVSGYSMVDAPNRASRPPTPHTRHEIHVSHKDGDVWILVHSTTLTPYSVEKECLMIRTLESELALEDLSIVSTTRSPCNCNDSEVMVISTYPYYRT